jgi:hypothetical protein
MYRRRRRHKWRRRRQRGGRCFPRPRRGRSAAMSGRSTVAASVVLRCSSVGGEVRGARVMGRMGTRGHDGARSMARDPR